MKLPLKPVTKNVLQNAVAELTLLKAHRSLNVLHLNAVKLAIYWLDRLLELAKSDDEPSG